MTTRTIESLAQLSNASPSKFIRRFTEAMDIAPGQYILRTRINAVCQLLEDTDRNLTTIAEQTGFYDLSHFTRIFKSIRGKTPGQYRNDHLFISR